MPLARQQARGLWRGSRWHRNDQEGRGCRLPNRRDDKGCRDSRLWRDQGGGEEVSEVSEVGGLLLD